jgi:hypothetical protein
MKTIVSGKKTYAAAIGMIVTALQPIFTDSGIDLTLVDGQMLWTGILAIFLRQGIAKSGPVETEEVKP